MFEKNFCPSPWLHMRINNTGDYAYCRWAKKSESISQGNISEIDPILWFRTDMNHVRSSLLRGDNVPGCAQCSHMEQHQKVSGRQRQLLKIGVTQDNFVKTMLSSNWLQEFKFGHEQNGATNQFPRDWQIDLGNFCNSACIFCQPGNSSRMATEYKKIGLIDKLPPAAWCTDPKKLKIFLDALSQCKDLAYLHFIGGETLITPAFPTILSALIENGLNESVTIGFTTNLTIWDQTVVDLLVQFPRVNVGLSVECFHPLNDYLRYGGEIVETTRLATTWVKLAQQQGWLTQIRITPTIFSIWHLDTVYEFAAQHATAVESCNFLDEPAFMRPSVLPQNMRAIASARLRSWIDRYPTTGKHQIINTRDPNVYLEQITQDAQSYLKYLQDQPDESHRLPDLVNFLSRLESSRKNRILDYLPEYEQILRSASYQ